MQRGFSVLGFPGICELPVCPPSGCGFLGAVNAVEVGKATAAIASVIGAVVVGAEGDGFAGIRSFFLWGEFDSMGGDGAFSGVEAHDVVVSASYAKEIDEVRFCGGYVDHCEGAPIIPCVGIYFGGCDFDNAYALRGGKVLAVSDPVYFLLLLVYHYGVVRDSVCGPARPFGPFAVGVFGISQVGQYVHSAVVHAKVQPIFVAVSAVASVIQIGCSLVGSFAVSEYG